MMLILPVSALVARRLPLGRTMKLALIWVVLFALATIVFMQIDR
ncbi:hypothetical protein [Sphingomonas sp.]|jgi:aspartyl protease family protein|nr:hypothetical protein [Sphingomonas sp.]